jgi:hypothetical protein
MGVNAGVFKTWLLMGYIQVVFFLREFWKWPKWLLFARSSNLATITSVAIIWLAIKKKLDETYGYFLFWSVVYLTIVGCIVYVNSG